jgi:hypothetical protein
MREEYPQATDVPMMFGSASMYATWAGALRDRLRAESPNGVSASTLWDSIVTRDAIATVDKTHRRAFHNALDYLANVGLAEYTNGLWYEIPLITRTAA